MAGPSTAGPLAAVVAAVVSVHVGAAVAKGLFPLVGAEGVVAVRVGLSALCLGLAFRVWTIRPDRQTALALIAYGVILGVMNLMIYQAFARIPIGVAVSIEVTGPLVVAAFASRRPMDFLWIGLAGLGLALLPWNGQAGGLSVPGVLFAFTAAACWALYIVFGSRVAHLGAGRSVAAGMVLAALITVPVGVIHAGPALISPHVLAVGAGVALLSSMIPYVLDMYAMGRLPKRVFGVLLSASPAVAALSGLVLLGETLAPAQWTGVAAIMLACAGAAWSRHRVRTPPAPGPGTTGSSLM